MLLYIPFSLKVELEAGELPGWIKVLAVLAEARGSIHRYLTAACNSSSK